MRILVTVNDEPPAWHTADTLEGLETIIQQTIQEAGKPGHYVTTGVNIYAGTFVLVVRTCQPDLWPAPMIITYHPPRHDPDPPDAA